MSAVRLSGRRRRELGEGMGGAEAANNASSGDSLAVELDDEAAGVGDL